MSHDTHFSSFVHRSNLFGILNPLGILFKTVVDRIDIAFLTHTNIHILFLYTYIKYKKCVNMSEW